MDAKTGRLGHGPHQCNDGSLAVGPGDMDDRRQPAMRVTKTAQKRDAALETQIDQFRMECRKPLKRVCGPRGVVRA